MHKTTNRFYGKDRERPDKNADSWSWQKLRKVSPDKKRRGLYSLKFISVLSEIQYEMSINCITALRPGGAKIPMTFDCDKDAIDAEIFTCGVDDIKNQNCLGKE